MRSQSCGILHMRCYKGYMNTCTQKRRIYGHLPFAFAVYLMLGEGDVFVVQSDTNVHGYLPQVLISRPLWGKQICRRTSQNDMYAGT